VKISNVLGWAKGRKNTPCPPPLIDVDILDETSSADPSIVDEDIDVAKIRLSLPVRGR